jgi:hypothetical protein
MHIVHASVIDADAGRVWSRVVTPEGIRDELMPWMTMRMPRAIEELEIDEVPVGEELGRAWLLLFGFLPFDYDRLVMAEIGPGHRFHERSSMASMRVWEHERTVEPLSGSSARITDRVTFEPRAALRWMTPALGVCIGALFRHRHRRLARYFARRHGHDRARA